MSGILNLSKGSILDLTKVAPAMKKVDIKLGWGLMAKKADLDLSAFLLDDRGRVLRTPDIPSNICWYKNERLNGIWSSGDNRRGGDEEAEVITVEFDKLKPEAQRIVFVVTIHEAQQNMMTFANVVSPIVRVYNSTTDAEEVAKFPLSDAFSLDCSAVLCELYKERGSWHFKAVGEGRGTDDLNDLLNSYL